MAFNLSLWWFSWAWPASQAADLKAWNGNYYLWKCHQSPCRCWGWRKKEWRQNSVNVWMMCLIMQRWIEFSTCTQKTAARPVHVNPPTYLLLPISFNNSVTASVRHDLLRRKHRSYVRSRLKPFCKWCDNGKLIHSLLVIQYEVRAVKSWPYPEAGWISFTTYWFHQSSCWVFHLDTVQGSTGVFLSHKKGKAAEIDIQGFVLTFNINTIITIIK